MRFIWTGLLPVALAFIILVPSILIAFDLSALPPPPPVVLLYNLRGLNKYLYIINVVIFYIRKIFQARRGSL